MRIEHVALWTADLERSRAFYEALGAQAGERYSNPRTGFSSYFLSFEGGARLELMQGANLGPRAVGDSLGYAHFALSVGGAAAVDELTERLRIEGVPVASEPRTTGDGYYESVVLDPDGNRVELVA
jgi:lactoylglutathione lyase